MGSFLNNPALKRLRIADAGYDPLRPWELQETLEYYSGEIEKVIVVPKGFKTDFASVPWFFRRVFPKDGEYSQAAVVHDYLCDRKRYDSRVAAVIFREAMLDLGVAKIKAHAMYLAVRLFGPRWGAV